MFAGAAGAFLLPAEPPYPVVACPCDHTRPASIEARVRGLCGTAEDQSGEVYFLKDINPHKPNRYLALPQAHRRDLQYVGGMDAVERERLWRRAIEKAEELFGPRWGLAHNGYLFRTQCHAHIHMGPLSPEVEDVGGKLYESPREFPAVGARLQ